MIEDLESLNPKKTSGRHSIRNTLAWLTALPFVKDWTQLSKRFTTAK